MEVYTNTQTRPFEYVQLLYPESKQEFRHHQVAYEALELYVNSLDVNERTDFIEHALRTEKLVRVFANDLIASRVYDAVMLHDLSQRAINSKHPARREAASIALADYLTDPRIDAESFSFVASLLSDVAVIEQAAEGYRKHLGGTTESERLQDILTNSYQGKLPPDMWLAEEPPIDIAHLRNITEDVNVESIIVKAAEVLDNITYPPEREAAVLQDILEIETFHAPLCEVLGFHALAMKLRTETNKQRLRRAGYEEAITQAEYVTEAARELGAHWALEHIFGVRPTEVAYETRDTSPHPEPVVYGTMKADDLTDNAWSGRVHWRVKTNGSLAKKLKDNPEQLPMDVFGMTAIVDTPEELAEAFRYMLDSLEANDSVTLSPAPSKEKAIYIQGCQEYIDTITSQLPDDLIEQAQIKLPEEGQTADTIYQVCKMTFYVHDDKGFMPVEMQFLTTPDRKNSRLGATAHILYKQEYNAGHSSMNLDELMSFLQGIYDRKKYMDRTGMTVNERSQNYSKQLFNAIEAQLFVHPETIKTSQ